MWIHLIDGIKEASSRLCFIYDMSLLKVDVGNFESPDSVTVPIGSVRRFESIKARCYQVNRQTAAVVIAIVLVKISVE
ncbi:uncharacterized protein RAG0_03626 [Rhynchosporium agropyri]|uniref:Uncharacterized protein n=1 Tax=Rhynchosporium agropyri TaxID=914238 RepID=A0A1E1K589_9HELO|nr:uncharacterized protein RAG0_03626 [Rhynchosporium agropyri]